MVLIPNGRTIFLRTSKLQNLNHFPKRGHTSTGRAQIIHSQTSTLSHNNKEGTCTRTNCPISGTKLCLLRNAVYQITCNNCNQHYIGSTTRFIHDRVREHLNNDNSPVKKHLSQSQNKVYKGIDIKSIVIENDPANLRLLEAFYIRKYKPIIN